MKNTFINNKRKNSNDDNNNNINNSISKENEKISENNSYSISEQHSFSNSISNEEQEKTKKKKKKKKKSKNENNNFKSVKPRQICQFYINGACKKGDKCPYSHDAEQIHQKELCKFFLSGKCTKGEKCLYSHDLSEIPCKYYHGLGFCENFQNCPFSHERLDEGGIKEFIRANEDFLRETKNKYGRTNMDEFYDKYIKEKEGSEEFVMLPDFIKKEDKEKEKKIKK